MEKLLRLEVFLKNGMLCCVESHLYDLGHLYGLFWGICLIFFYYSKWISSHMQFSIICLLNVCFQFFSEKLWGVCCLSQLICFKNVDKNANVTDSEGLKRRGSSAWGHSFKQLCLASGGVITILVLASENCVPWWSLEVPEGVFYYRRTEGGKNCKMCFSAALPHHYTTVFKFRQLLDSK